MSPATGRVALIFVVYLKLVLLEFQIKVIRRREGERAFFLLPFTPNDQRPVKE